MKISWQQLQEFYPGLNEKRFKQEVQLYSNTHQLPLAQAEKEFLQRCLKGEPFAYINGWSYFYDSEYRVTQDCLIPRFESEILVELVVQLMRKEQLTQIAEIGVGSGALFLSVLRSIDFPVKILATDLCAKALQVAKWNYFLQRNSIHHQTQVNLIVHDRLKEIEQNFDLIFSNPPYIPSDSKEVHPQVDLFEPGKALYLDKVEYNSWYQLFFEQALANLSSGGYFLLEGHENHLADLAQLAKSIGFSQANLKRDYTQRDRFLILKK